MDQCVKYGLQIKGRATYDFEDIGRSGLLLTRLFQLACSAIELFLQVGNRGTAAAGRYPRAARLFAPGAERSPVADLGNQGGGDPMIKESELMGAIVIYRQEVRPFTNKQAPARRANC